MCFCVCVFCVCGFTDCIQLLPCVWFRAGKVSVHVHVCCVGDNISPWVLQWSRYLRVNYPQGTCLPFPYAHACTCTEGTNRPMGFSNVTTPSVTKCYHCFQPGPQMSFGSLTKQEACCHDRWERLVGHLLLWLIAAVTWYVWMYDMTNYVTLRAFYRQKCLVRLQHYLKTEKES